MVNTQPQKPMNIVAGREQGSNASCYQGSDDPTSEELGVCMGQLLEE